MIDPLFWMGRRVLVTGHTGFKGSWLSLWLTQLGAKVCGVALKPDITQVLFDQLEIAQSLEGHHLIDIRSFADIETIVSNFKPQIVIHLAAQSLVRSSYEDPLGTWSINVQGSLNLLEALKPIKSKCAVVMVTTDKVYANQEWDYGYREEDRLGGQDPYSASKAAAELAVASWRSSFCGNQSYQNSQLEIATARAGNVIGGGDWAHARIMPDAMRSLCAGKSIPVRNQNSTRPWQHVLEPLSGYLLLAEKLFAQGKDFRGPYNFGPTLEANHSVIELVETALSYWPGSWHEAIDRSAPHEASRLHLQIDKAHHQLGWTPRWTFETTVKRTVGWYRGVHEGRSPRLCCLNDLDAYLSDSATNTSTEAVKTSK